MSAGRDNSRIVVGLVVVLVGVLALADNLLGFESRRVLEFWPVVFVVVGAAKLAQTRHASGLLFGGLLVVVGLLMTLSNLGWVSFRLRDWWPVFVIAAGLALIWRDPMRRHLRQAISPSQAASPTGLNAFAVMSGNRLSVADPDFQQGEATAVMGSVQIDFRQASMQNTAQLRVFAFWGGVEIWVPTDWRVESRALAIMGGIDDKSIPGALTSKTLVIDGFVMMGGVVIRN